MSEAIVLAMPTDERRPWARAVAWLCLLGPFFFLSYGAANWLAAQRAEVGSVVFDWERGIPFLPWTIVPYWSIDAFYGLSLLVCTSKAELDNHARRLLTTYQHHFIDLPTGALLGFLCLWLWPDAATGPVAGARLTLDPKRRHLAACYSAGAVLFAAPALAGGVALWLLWPAVSLAFVAA